MELENILEKASNRIPLNKRERKILDVYMISQSEINRDFVYLSKNATFNKIAELLDHGKVVICNLHDKNGKIEMPIIGIQNNFEDETCTIVMKNYNHKLQDSFLYNLIYNVNRNEYSLQEQDEYFEKIENI